MATIPVASLRPVAPATIGGGVSDSSARAESAAYGAAGQLGQGIANIGEALGRIALDRQQHVNQGILANEDVIRQNTFAEVQKFATANQNNPQAWSAFAKDKWQEYEEGRTARQEAEGWGPDVRQRDTIEMQSFQARANRLFDADQNKALIRQSNTRLDTLAQNYADSGDFQKAAEVIAMTDRYDDEKSGMIQKVVSGGIYHQYDRTLSDIGQMTLAQQQEQLKAVESNLTAKSKDGGYENGKARGEDGEMVGELSEQGRIDLIRQTRARQRAVESEMTTVGHSLIRRAQYEEDPEALFSDALNKGQITEEVAAVFLPEVKGRILERRADKQAKEDERLGIRRDKAEVAARAQINAPRGATLTMDEIEKREARGITRPNDPTALTADAANRLRQELQAVQEGDMVGKDFSSIADSLDDRLGRGVIGTWFSDNAQMSPEEKNKMLERIGTAKISTGAKVKLMDKFFEVQKWDLREGEITDTDGDRNIGPEEKDLRSNAIEVYRKAASTLGPKAIGGRYMADMEKISQWFRANPDASPAIKAKKTQEFYAEIRKGVDNEAGNALIRSIPIYNE